MRWNLHEDAPPVPDGMRPREGVWYGCGEPGCLSCYEPFPEYQVFETPCFPAKWKVGRSEDDSNATHNYFRDKQDAMREADRRNGRSPSSRSYNQESRS